MTGSTSGEESFIAKNMDANIHAPSAGGVGTPNGHYFGGMTQGGGEGLSASIGGKIGSTMQNVSIDQAISPSGNLDNVLGSFKGDAMSSNPFSVADRFMPVQNLGAAGQAIQQTGKGLSDIAKINSLTSATGSDITGNTSLFSQKPNSSGMQMG
ncbi:MAG: hypothetical protein RL769_247 [Pseudomonadota bacterium]|jgi:hypothetical protein